MSAELIAEYMERNKDKTVEVSLEFFVELYGFLVSTVNSIDEGQYNQLYINEQGSDFYSRMLEKIVEIDDPKLRDFGIIVNRALWNKFTS